MTSVSVHTCMYETERLLAVAAVLRLLHVISGGGGARGRSNVIPGKKQNPRRTRLNRYPSMFAHQFWL